MMLKLRTRKALVAGLAALALLLTACLYAIAQQAMDESKRDRTVAVPGGKYTLEDFVILMTWHDDNHLDQLNRALEGKV